MINGKLIAVALFPLGNGGSLLLQAQLSNGALYGFVGVGSSRPELSTYDPNNWREVQRVQRAIESGKMPAIRTQFPYWEALPPVPGTDAYDDDIKEHGPLASVDVG